MKPLARRDNSVQPAIDVKRLLEKFISEQSPQTKKAYEQDLDLFAKWMGKTRVEACAEFIGKDAAGGNLMASDFIAAMKGKYASATIGRKLSALRSLTRMARIFGMITWSVEIRGPKTKKYRDTHGPTMDEFRQMIECAAKSFPAKAARDVALLRIAFSDGLRRKEIYGLNYSDFDFKANTVRVVGKGKTEEDPDFMDVPQKTMAAIKEWVKYRGTELGPMFFSLHAGRIGKPLTGDGVYWIVTTIAKQCGLKVRPHGIRHSLATTMRRNGFTIDETQKRMRHSRSETTLLYDDNLRRFDSKIGDRVDDLV